VKKWLLLFVAAMLLVPVMRVDAVAGAKFKVRLQKCVDGDTAYFSGAGKTRFLYVDTPESTIQHEAFGKEASTYTCSMLSKAKVIQLQYDGVRKDKYQRTLAWVWVDGKLLQQLLVQKGYVEKFYDYGTYSYESLLRAAQQRAIATKVGLWRNASSASKVNGSTTTVSGSKVYANCTALRVDFPNGVPKSSKFYQAKMDRDHDGYACEQ
jgi:micrococcal nuclease